MLYYCKIINNGYVEGIASSENTLANAISESDANRISNTFLEKPLAPDGYTYKLRSDNMEWKLVELPEPEQIDENAEISDYENALSDLGVRFGD